MTRADQKLPLDRPITFTVKIIHASRQPSTRHRNVASPPPPRGTSVVVDLASGSLPAIVYWGADLGSLSTDAVTGMVTASRPQRVSGGLDQPSPLTLLPLESHGWQGTPGLLGSRSGTAFSPSFSITGMEQTAEQTAEETATGLLLTAVDSDAGLDLAIDLRLDEHGLLHQQLHLTNTGKDDYGLIELAATFPLPHTAGEILDTTGRHLRERSPQRHAVTVGRYDRESRRGRPGADATLLLSAGTPGFGFERGLVHAVHLAWSGNHRASVERTITGATLARVAELLAPGEVVLAPGQSYTTPVATGSWGEGLTELSARFHQLLRARPQHPASDRPVTLNTWEAVYFEHDLARLTALADAGARVGVERFVLDDGWFHGRRDDTAGLGDWYVDKEVWPNGLGPLIEHVTGLGMQFGLWVEPEMVNPDSDLARAHPEWILSAGHRLPIPARQQQVLDLSNPDAEAYLLERLDALLTEYDIAYLKWDHNRDLLEAGSGSPARPAVHNNVTALYRLLDELKRRHPFLEIESCASGGARVDLGILDHTDRIWASDCIDPLERLTIQKYTNLLVPYELLGAHIGGESSHSTGRHSSLSLRAGVALPGHLGIEWDISNTDPAVLQELAGWVDVHKRHRHLLHTGTSVHADLPDASMDLRGVVSPDRGHALYSFTQVTTSASYPPGPITFPGLDDDRDYRVTLTAPTAVLNGPGQSPLPWTQQGVTMPGRALRLGGVQAPVLFPEQLLLIEVTAA